MRYTDTHTKPSTAWQSAHIAFIWVDLMCYTSQPPCRSSLLLYSIHNVCLLPRAVEDLRGYVAHGVVVVGRPRRRRRRHTGRIELCDSAIWHCGSGRATESESMYVSFILLLLLFGFARINRYPRANCQYVPTIIMILIFHLEFCSRHTVAVLISY